MKVIIEVRIGNEAMQTWQDVADALAQPLNHSFGAISTDDKFVVFDANGNSVGTVTVEG